MSGKATVFVINDDPGSGCGQCMAARNPGPGGRERTPRERSFSGPTMPRHPGCILLDLRMPKMDSIELQAAAEVAAGLCPHRLHFGAGKVAKCRRP